MNKKELLEIISNGENSGVEFKRDDIPPEKIARECVAFANLKGGMILLGVEDDGTISGLKRPNCEEWVMDSIFGNYIHPRIIPYYEEVAVNGTLRVGIIRISTGTAKPYALRHKQRKDIYIRTGSTSQLASREIIRYSRDYGYMDDRGMGIRKKVIPLMIENNKLEPKFAINEDYFKVILRKRN